MLLVIFGAGASYDSVLHFPPPAPRSPTQSNFGIVETLIPPRHHEEFRPPLANQLFDDRPLFVQVMQNFAACKPLVNLLRGNVQVERQLAKFEEEAKTYPIRNRQLAAIRYYLHEMLWNCQVNWMNEHRGITNYVTFVDAIERWRYGNNEQVCFVTFNYDTMLEQSLTELWGVKFDDLGSYTSHPHFKLIKLHGSIDWGLELNGNMRNVVPSLLVGASLGGIDVSQHFRKVVHTPMVFENQTYGFPALAIPVEKKSEFVCPPEHLRELADSLPTVTKIITVGWRATEQKFLTMLKKPLTGLQGDVDLMVVSGTIEGATETNTNLGLVNPSSGHKYPTVGTGFSGLVRGIGQLEDFLK
jgi:hypothetical protein